MAHIPTPEGSPQPYGDRSPMPETLQDLALGISSSLCSSSSFMMLFSLFGRSVTSDSLQLHGLQPARLLCPWHVPGKNTGVGFHFLFQWVFQTQGWDLYLLHWQVDSLLLSDLGSPSFMKPFNKLGNVSISLSSMSCSSKLIKSQEEAVGTSDLKPEVVIA